MKLFDVDWPGVLRDLPRWSALPLAARRVLLEELKPTGYVPAARFGDSLDAIAASGIAHYSAEHKRLWVADEHRGLLKVLRAMHRHPVFDDPNPVALVKYMEEHLTQEEIEALGSRDHRTRYITRHSLAPRVAFAGWAGDLLAACDGQALAAWGQARGLAPQPDMHAQLRGLQALVRRLLAAPDGVPLRELMAGAEGDALLALASAIHAGLATLVVFGGMRGTDLEPMVGLWPHAAKALARPPAGRPSAVAAREVFELAVRMEDMTTVLGAVIAAPVRLRAEDMAVFARIRTSIEERLVAPPEWAAHLFVNPSFTRVDLAARELERLGHVRVRQINSNPHLESTATGARWLALSPRDRLADLIDPIRASQDVNPPGAYYMGQTTAFFPFTLPYLSAPKSLNVRETLTRAFLDAGDGFIPLEPFLSHATEEANPFLALLADEPRQAEALLMYFDGRDPRETYRNLWRNSVAAFFTSRLLGLGGARVGRERSGALCFELTDVGRYLLGAGSSFTYGDGATADIVVQPNFDVVFLGAAPSTEAQLARFAERVGAAPGLTLRITRASVLAAAQAGAAAEDVIDAFRTASSKPMPKNVEREITGWMAAVRRARIRALQVIECADAETADRVAAALGAKAQRLTPTIVELPAASAAARAASLKRLRAGGVFLEDATHEAEPRAKPRRRTYDDAWDDE